MATVRNPFDEDDDVSITMLDPDEEPSPESDDNGANVNADRKTRRNDKSRNAINPFTADGDDEDEEDENEDIPIVIPESSDGTDDRNSDTDNDSSDNNPPVANEVIDNDGNDEVTIVMPEEDGNDSSVSVEEESSSSPVDNDNHTPIKITSKFNRKPSTVNDNDSSVENNEPDKSQHDDKTDSHHWDTSTDNHDDSVSSESEQVQDMIDRPSFNPFVDVDSDEDNVEIGLPDEDKKSSNDSATTSDGTVVNVEDSSGPNHHDDEGNDEKESTDSMESSESDDHGVPVVSSDVVDGSSVGESSGEGEDNDEDSSIEKDEESSDGSTDDDVDVVMLEPESSVDEDAVSDDGSESKVELGSDEKANGLDETKVNETDDDKSHGDGKPVEEASREDKDVVDDDHVGDNHDGDESESAETENDEEDKNGSVVDGEQDDTDSVAGDDGSDSDVDDSDETNDDGNGSPEGKPVSGGEDASDSMESGESESSESVDSGSGSQSSVNDDDGVDSDTASGVGEPSGGHGYDDESSTTDEDTVAGNDGDEETVGSVGNVENTHHVDASDDEGEDDGSSLSGSDDENGSDSQVDDTVTDGDSSSDDGEDLIRSWDDEDAGSDEGDDVDNHDGAPDDETNGSTVDEDEESDNHVDGSPEENEDDSESDEEPVEDENDGHEESGSQESDDTPEEDGTDSDSDDDDGNDGLDEGSGDGDDGVVFPIGDEGDWVDEEPDEYDEVVEDEDDEGSDDDTVNDGSDSDEVDPDDDDEDAPAEGDEDDGESHSDDSGDDLVGLFHEPTDFAEDEDADDGGEPVDSDLEALFADRSSVEMLNGGHHGKSGRAQSRTRDGSGKPKTGDRNKNHGHHDSPDDGKNSSDDVNHHREGGSTRSGPKGRPAGSGNRGHDLERSPGRIDLAEVVGDGDDVADEATLRFDEESAAGRWGSHGLATGTAIGGAVHSLHSQGRIHNHKAIEDPEKARALTVREWQMGHGVRFTARDVAALDYLTRWSYATTAQVARAGGWRDRKESRLMRRFETWEDMGWAHADREFAGPVLWTPTNAGSSFGPHAWLGGVNYHRVNPVSQSHSLGLSSLASWLLSGWGDDVLHLGDDWPVLKAELADGRAYLVSEREIRSGYIRIRSEGRGLVPIRYRCAMLGGADPMGRDPQPSRFRAFSKAYASGEAGLEDSPEYLACDPEELGREQWLWVVWGDWIWNRDPATREQSYVPVEDRYDVNTNRPIVDRTRGDVFALLDHVPDMVIARLRNEDGSSRSLAIELELKDKGTLAYERTMASYGSRLGRLLYDRVLWVVPNSTVALSLYRAANNVGMVRGEDYEIIPFYTVERRNSYWTGADIVPAVWGRNNRVIPTIDPNSFLLS